MEIGRQILLVEIFGASCHVRILYCVYGCQEFTVIKSQILFSLGLLSENCLLNGHLPFREDVLTVDPSEPPGKLSHSLVDIRCINNLVFDILFNGVYSLLLHGLDEDVSATYEECFLLFCTMTPHDKDHPLFAGILPV